MSGNFFEADSAQLQSNFQRRRQIKDVCVREGQMQIK